MKELHEGIAQVIENYDMGFCGAFESLAYLHDLLMTDGYENVAGGSEKRDAFRNMASSLFNDNEQIRDAFRLISNFVFQLTK